MQIIITDIFIIVIVIPLIYINAFTIRTHTPLQFYPHPKKKTYFWWDISNNLKFIIYLYLAQAHLLWNHLFFSNVPTFWNFF